MNILSIKQKKNRLPRRKKMPSRKKQTRRPQRPFAHSEEEWRAFTEALAKFKEDGTGSRIDATLLAEFPLFHGKAPPGHPYPNAFKGGATDEKYCYVEAVDGLVLLRRRLPNGRVINIDTCDFDMLNGGVGIAHINMNNGDNRVENLKMVTEAEARKMLLEYEVEEHRYKIVTVLPDGS